MGAIGRHAAAAAVCAALLVACGGGGGDAPALEAAAHAPTVISSGDARVDALLAPAEHRWDWNHVAPGRPLRYTFDPSHAVGVLSSPGPVNAAQREAALAVLAQASAITGIAFVEASGPQSAHLHFATGDRGVGGPFGFVQWIAQRPAVHIAFNNAIGPNADTWEQAKTVNAPLPGTVGYAVLLHEVGHALGLKHATDGAPALPATDQVMDNTVMTPVRLYYPQPRGFLPYDVLALKWIYGGDGLGGERGFNSRLGPTLD